MVGFLSCQKNSGTEMSLKLILRNKQTLYFVILSRSHSQNIAYLFTDSISFLAFQVTDLKFSSAKNLPFTVLAVVKWVWTGCNGGYCSFISLRSVRFHPRKSIYFDRKGLPPARIIWCPAEQYLHWFMVISIIYLSLLPLDDVSFDICLLLSTHLLELVDG